MKYGIVYKGYTRCFVFNKKHAKIVEETIKEIDKYEFIYMPQRWIAFWDYKNEKRRPPLIYSGNKFDIDIINLKIECAKKGVAVLIVTSNFAE